MTVNTPAYSVYKTLLYTLQTNRSMIAYDPLSEQQKYEIRQQVRRYIGGQLDEIDVRRHGFVGKIVCHQY